MRIIRAAVLLCLFGTMVAARAEPASAKKISILHVGAHTVQAEIVDTRQSRELGLMWRTHLCENCGMLFVFDKAAKHGFWMKNTLLPLSIAFINVQGIIINISEMQAGTSTIHRAHEDALYALEMNQGWFSRHGIKPGDRVQGFKTIPE